MRASKFLDAKKIEPKEAVPASRKLSGKDAGALARAAKKIVVAKGKKITEFLLVPYVGACVHTPPPPPNQLVYVMMNDAEKVSVSFWDPVWIHGTLEVEETTNVYGSVSFKLSGTEVQPYEW